MHDLHHVPLSQRMTPMQATGHDLAVDLHRHPALGELFQIQQLLDGDAVRKLAGCAIELDVHDVIVP